MVEAVSEDNDTIASAIKVMHYIAEQLGIDWAGGMEYSLEREISQRL